MFTQRTCPHEPEVRKDEPEVETGVEPEASREDMERNERLEIEDVETLKEKRWSRGEKRRRYAIRTGSYQHSQHSLLIRSGGAGEFICKELSA